MSTPTDDPPASHPRVRADLRIGSAVLVAVIGGHLLWQVSDTGILAAIGTH